MRPTVPADIVWAANYGTVIFHTWPTRHPDNDHPDQLRIDLDPSPGTDFDDVRRVAIDLVQPLLTELDVTGFVKTSGSRGIHVFVPIEPRWDFIAGRRAVIALARELERRDPESVTTSWWKEERGQRIFIDFNQNARDRSMCAPYSVRHLRWPGVDAGHLGRTSPTSTRRRSRWPPCRISLPGARIRGPTSMSAGQVSNHCWRWWTATRRTVSGHAVPAELPQDAGEPPRVQPSKKVAAHWDEHGNRVEE